MVDIINLQELADAKLDAQSLELFINGDVDEEVLTRLSQQYPSLQNFLFQFQKYNSRAYKTYAEMDADKANISAKSKVTVTNDTTASNNGDWQWDGAVFTKSSYDPLQQSKEYTKSSVAPLSENLSEIKKTDEAATLIPVLVDSNNKILIGYNTEKDQIEAGGLKEQVFENLINLMKSGDTNKVAVLTDEKNQILIGYDTENDKAIIAGLELQNPKRTIAQYNGMHGYGQSLGVGATATDILSTSQPYANKTFSTGPRMDSPATSIIPLVEQFNSPSSDGYNNRGETFCSGAANYASRLMMLQKNVNPQDHMIFASAAGHGGYRLDQLKKGTAWYDFFLRHITETKRLVGSESYQVQATPWTQGENDALTSQQTPKSIYKPELSQLQKDISADVKRITGQIDDVVFITYQMSYAARTWPDQALAQLELVQENDSFGLSTPMYHMHYASDSVHLTNVGYKWLGAYIGRAYTQFVVDNRKPDFINPLSAQLIDDEIHISFNVPKLPLVLDTTTLAVTTNHGFKVMNDAVEIAITSVTASDNAVVLQLASTPSNDVKVRYALDYLGVGINLTGGASGNLRDSTTDSVMIAGVEKPLYHVCPHFEMTAFIDKGI